MICIGQGRSKEFYRCGITLTSKHPLGYTPTAFQFIRIINFWLRTHLTTHVELQSQTREPCMLLWVVLSRNLRLPFDQNCSEALLFLSFHTDRQGPPVFCLSRSSRSPHDPNFRGGAIFYSPGGNLHYHDQLARYFCVPWAPPSSSHPLQLRYVENTKSVKFPLPACLMTNYSYSPGIEVDGL